MRTLARIGFTLSGLIALFWVWYCIAANYGYQALSGTYVIDRAVETCTLVLKADGTFFEALKRPNSTQTASGTWRRIGEAGVEFSSFVPDTVRSKAELKGRHLWTLRKDVHAVSIPYFGIGRRASSQTLELVTERMFKMNCGSSPKIDSLSDVP